jgi:hypothetical protein
MVRFAVFFRSPSAFEWDMVAMTGCAIYAAVVDSTFKQVSSLPLKPPPFYTLAAISTTLAPRGR